MGTTYAPCVGGRKEYKGYKIIFQHLFKISDENRIRDGGFGARAEIGNLRVFDFVVDFYCDPSETPLMRVVLETLKGVPDGSRTMEHGG